MEKMKAAASRRAAKNPEVQGSRSAASPTRRPTMTEVALAAGVSQTTVSLVLNRAAGARLSVETRHRVEEAARALGYQLERGGGLRASKADAGMIGFVVDELSTDPWMAIGLDGAREAAWKRGLTVSVAVTRGDPQMEKTIFKRMMSPSLVGWIYGTINTRRVHPYPVFYRKPLILLNCYVADQSLPSVVPAEVIGGHTAAQRLVDAGHRRIGFINGEPWMDASRDRLKGYRQALASADIPYDADLVRSGNWEPATGYAMTRELMALKRPPTAIFCANDLMAAGCYDALRELGLSIPADISVIGYDDREIARYLRPPLTSVVLPHFEMGAAAVEYLIDHANGLRRPWQLKIEGPLAERQSIRNR
jgi:LacI family transcriptional regulator